MQTELFILGAGSMAEAFLRGVIVRKALAPDSIVVMNRSNRDRALRLQAEYGVRIAESISEAAVANVIVIAVKPMDVEKAIEPLRAYWSGKILLSFAAGIPISWFAEKTEYQAKVVRAMPNLPVAVQHGVTAIARAQNVVDTDMAHIQFLLEQVGTVIEMDESFMDAATAFSGSGPGFVSYFLEAMEKAAVELGFDAQTARKLLLQTVVGTALTLQEWGLSPEELRHRVTSPNGTTHAGLCVFDDHELLATVKHALQAAANRSAEMGRAYLRV